MSMFGRRSAPSRAVLDSLALVGGERVLVAAEVPGGWALASSHALHVVSLGDGDSPVAARSVRWTDVHQAALLPQEEALEVLLVDGARWTVPVGRRPGRLPEAVRERIQNSIVLARRVQAKGGGIHVVARRTPEEELSVQVFGDRGVDLTQPSVQEELAATEAVLRNDVGLPPR